MLAAAASVLIHGLGHLRGIKIRYLFNLFDYWGTVVTSHADIKTLADLKGTADSPPPRATTNFTVFEWFAHASRASILVPRPAVLNTATSGLIGYALADRADAVQIWEPAYSMLLARLPDIRSIDLNIAKVWRDYAGAARFPNLGVAAHQDWIDENPDMIPRLYLRLHGWRPTGWCKNPPRKPRPSWTPGQVGPGAEAIRTP